MAKVEKEARDQEEAFEMIELATEDLEVLARAFHVIEEVCDELQNPNPQLEEEPQKLLLN